MPLAPEIPRASIEKNSRQNTPSQEVAMPIAELLGSIGRMIHDINAQRNASALASETAPDFSELRDLIAKAETALNAVRTKLVSEAPTQEEINALQEVENQLKRHLSAA